MINLSPNLINKMLKEHRLRVEITKNSIQCFFGFYFSHYIQYEAAPFHFEMFKLIEDTLIRLMVIVAFRGSAKSTIMNLVYPLWAILGVQQKKFVLIVAQTQNQARQYIKNLKAELEKNELLRRDLGPFKEQDDEWRSFSLVLPLYNARITAVSVDQSIRGIRHFQHRPDLIICDDIEDLASVKTMEGRDKIYQWINGELLPAGDKNKRVIFIGNLLHQDSVLMRIIKDIQEKRRDGIYKFYPLLNKNGDCLWPGKYPTEADIKTEKKQVGNDVAWLREYILQIIADEGQVVNPKWIQYYAEIPEETHDSQYRFTKIGVDLAISKEDSANYTAMVSAKVYGYGENIKIYILPNIIEKRLTFSETSEEAKMLSMQLEYKGSLPEFIVEDVGYQRAFIEELTRKSCIARPFKPEGDKRGRLAAASSLRACNEII